MDSEDNVRNFHQKRGRIGIRKKSIPDPDPGGKKAPDPGSATLVSLHTLFSNHNLFKFCKLMFNDAYLKRQCHEIFDPRFSR
jgi:hypothetical protein